MSATYQITSAQITGFIASNLSQLEEFLAADLELFYKESAPEHFDYEYCRNALRRHLERQDSQLQGLCLLFLHHPEICKEIHAAMDALKQLYQSRFLEVIALEFPKQQSSIDQSSLSFLVSPVETIDDSTVELQKNLEFYLAHTTPNDSGIDAIINSAQQIGTFEQYGMQSWIFKGVASVGHILYLCRNPDRYLMCYANYPYQAFSTLDDAQKRILALDVLLHNKTSSVDQGEHQ